MNQPVVSARNLRLRYGDTSALNGASLELQAAERVALMGPSGSGKSSLLHCLAGVVTPQNGEIWFEGERLDRLSEARRSAVRLQRMGMVFQFGDLVPELTLVENVLLPLRILGTRRRAARTAAMELLDRLGVADVADHRTGAVSGGQAQRAAVARALVHQPAVVFADEPTGSLDSVTAERVLDAMVSLTRESGAALFVVTHDNIVASHLDRHLVMHDGATSDTVGASR
jgi:putative ABC transport system ATP-binding protein